jgi:multidrug efflux pump
MNSFFSAIHKNRLIFFIIAVATIIFGFFSYLAIPKEQFPDIKLPTVNITIILAGVSPEDAEKMIVLPVEKAFHSLDDVKKVTSFAMNGVANITVQFNQNVDPSKGTQDIRNKIQEARSDLPQDILEPIQKYL